MTTSPVCPGSENLLTGDGHRYLRVVFTAYWADSAPSTEVFYFTKHRIWLTYKGIEKLEAFALSQLQGQDADALRAIYVTYVGVELDDDDVAALGWRVIAGDMHPHPETPDVPVDPPTDPVADSVTSMPWGRSI